MDRQPSPPGSSEPSSPAGGGAAVPTESVRIAFTLDGVEQACDVAWDEAALETLRERLGATCVKEGCGHGECGACTVQVDGVPQVTCLLPSTALDGCRVTSAAGLASGAELHPVQRAFVARDALQCGACTAGFVVEAAAFHDRWRDERGTDEPTRDDVAGALAGHLCRCSAQPNILAAVRAACAGRFDGPTDQRTGGRADADGPRRGAVRKVTGGAHYTADVRRPGQLVGLILRSPHAHARVLSIDTGPALALDGVEAVHVFRPAGSLVRHVGQEVVAVAAVDRGCAEAGRRAIALEWEVLPAAIGMEAARAVDAPRVYSHVTTRKPLANELPVLPGFWNGNVRGPSLILSRWPLTARLHFLLARWLRPERVVEGTWKTQMQSHAALEPHCCVAEWQDGRLLVHASTQACAEVAADLAELHDLDPDDVDVACEDVGGAFGAKAELTPEILAAVELARSSGRPVGIVLDRAEEMSVTGHRPGAVMDAGLVLGRKGRIRALSLTSHADSGVAVGASVGSAFRFSYRCPFLAMEHDVVSHDAPGKAMRAPGGPPGTWALETLVDEAAARAGIDPLELRRRSDRDAVRRRLYDWAAALPAWRERGPVAADRGRFRRGVGVASATWPYFVQTDVKARATIGADGIRIATATQDIGTGTETVIASAVASELGVDSAEIDVAIGHSREVLGPMSSGSRTTTSIAPTAADAARHAADRLAVQAERVLGLRDARWLNGRIVHEGGVLPWREAAGKVGPVEAIGRRRRDRGGWVLPFAIPGLDLHWGHGTSAGIQVSEVEVDARIGKVRVLRTWARFAVGRLVTPELARSQAIGGIVQAQGFALYEERRLDPVTGTVLTRDLESYRIPGVGDVPEVDVSFDEEGFDHVVGGGVGLGELTVLPGAAAIGNAVHHATGWRPRELPLRPDRVRDGIAS